MPQNNKYCRQIWIFLTKSFHSVSTGHKQAKAVLVLTNPSYEGVCDGV